MKSVLLLPILVVVSFAAFCQEQSTTYYFDNDLNLTAKSKSIYTGSGKKVDSLYELELYEKKDKYHIFTAFYTDSTFAVMDGRFISYYKNGNVENNNYYKKGQPDGLWLKWDSDKKILDSTWYRDGKPDSSVIFKYAVLSQKLHLIERNNFIDSISVLYRFDEYGGPLAPQISDTTYKNDKIVILNPDEKVEFAGGEDAMKNYFQYQFGRHKFELISNEAFGMCHVATIVDKTGNVTDLVILSCDNSILARVVGEIVRSVVWLPAEKDGKPVTGTKEISTEYYPAITGMTGTNKKKYYFNKDFSPAASGEAEYFGKITSEDNLVKLTVHDSHHLNRIFSIHFTDSSFETANGVFEKFDFDDQKVMRGSLLLGRKNGVWLYWDKTGRVIDSSIYSIGIKTSETILTYQPEGGLASMKVRDYNAGTERYVFYDKKAITDKRAITSDVTINLQGDEEDDTDKIFTNAEIAPSFPGGTVAWLRYLDKYISSSMGRINRFGMCVVRFVVDTSGRVSDVKALTLQGTTLAKIAIKSIVDGPNWVPALQHGRKVKSYMMQSVNIHEIRMRR